MKQFFRNTRPGKQVKHGRSSFELPVLYYRDDCFALYFSADAGKVKALMPSDSLHPVLLPNGRAIYAVAVFNYIETTIGPYGEIAAAIPVIHGKKPSKVSGITAALMESKFPGFGVLVHHLPVTSVAARDAGRGEWGYTKFTADMKFKFSPESMGCSMSEDGQNILDIRVYKRGFYLPENKPLTTYSVKDGYLIKTVIPMKARKRVSLRPTGSFLMLGDHPVAQSIREMDLSASPILSIYYPERAVILPSGRAIESDVRELNGYKGSNRKGKLEVNYLD